MVNIERELDALIRREGGFVDHPHDRGGPTCWGITEAVARQHGYEGAMADMPQAQARDIYRGRYWEAPKFNVVAAIWPRVAVELFDTGVNMGPATAVAFLQRNLNALNRQGREWPDVLLSRKVDGPTLTALQALRARRGATGEQVLLKALDALQGARYIEIAEARAAQESFVFGWLDKRLGALNGGAA